MSDELPVGRLDVVGTPIGNLGDMTLRATEVLGRVDLIVCEDSRRTGRLLQHFGIAAPRLLVANDHTEKGIGDAVLQALGEGSEVALVSDAGMPAISDPGRDLVRQVIDAGFEVSVVPGPSAVSAALVVSGLATARFVMEGFLPRKGPERRARLGAIVAEQRTVVIFESPRRLKATLVDLAAVCGPQRSAAVARELTKLYEEIARGSLGELIDHFSGVVKGEVVLVLDGADEPPEPSDEAIDSGLVAAIEAGATRRDAVGLVAQSLGVSRNRVYERSLER